MDNLKIQHNLKQAIKHWNQGDIAGAKKKCNLVLKKISDNSEANYLASIISRSSRDLKKALFHINKAIEKDPGNAAFYNERGLIFQESENFEQAYASFIQAIEIMPDNADYFYNLGNAMFMNSSFAEAEEVLHKVISINPQYIEAYKILGLSLHLQGKIAETIETYKIALQIKPDCFDIVFNYGDLLRSLGRYEIALGLFQRALMIEPDHVLTLNKLGETCVGLNEYDRAYDYYLMANRIEPDNTKSLVGMTAVSLFRGDYQLVEKQCREVLKLDPTSSISYLSLSSLKDCVTDDDIKAMESIYGNAKKNLDKINLNFALGKSYEHKQDYDKAFDYFTKGNLLQHSDKQFDVADVKEKFETVKQVFNQEFVSEHQGMGYRDESPIFIIGMPRSGTSLVEQILSSHPEVSGKGELPYISELANTYKSDMNICYPDNIRGITENELKELGERYIKKRKYTHENNRFIVDKLPHNFLFAGFIHLILPDAKIIHCRRNPIDTCKSIFTNHFTKRHPYSSDLINLAEYYRLYQSLMEHWRSVMSDSMFEIEYESLIDDQEKSTRALLEHCNLKWDEACMSFHKTKRITKTLSASQVRRPIYQSSVNSWKPYEKQLKPLLDILQINNG